MYISLSPNLKCNYYSSFPYTNKTVLLSKRYIPSCRVRLEILKIEYELEMLFNNLYDKTDILKTIDIDLTRL